MPPISKRQLARMIEATCLGATVTQADMKELCKHAVHMDLYGVCIPPCWVGFAHKLVKGSNVKVVTVVGFPYGYDSVSVKSKQIEVAAEDGAQEVDYVINLSQYFSKHEGLKALNEEAHTLSVLARRHRLLLKGIIETAVLFDAQKVVVARTLMEAGVDMIKTSTGTIHGGGAKTKDVALLRKVLGPDIRIKASGDIRTFKQACALVAAGACRIGTSHVAEIIDS